jgi:small conductance mechanosensitive channel
VNVQPLLSLILAQVTNSTAGKTNSPAASFRDFLSPQRVEKFVEDNGSKIAIAVIIIIAGFIIARWAGRLIEKALLKRELEPPVRMLLVRLAKLLIILLTVIMAIDKLGFPILSLVAGLSVAGVGVGLAMQGVLSNLVAGLTIIFVKKFRVGEYIEINAVHGQVDTIELFSTTLIHPDRSRVIIPNRKIVGEIIHNYGKIRQLDLSVGIAYDSDLNRALALISEILARNPRVLKDPAPAIGTAMLGDSSIVIAIKPWTSVTDFGPAGGEINKALIERFREAKINMPFPQREIRLLPGSEIKNAAA